MPFYTAFRTLLHWGLQLSGTWAAGEELPGLT